MKTLFKTLVIITALLTALIVPLGISYLSKLDSSLQSISGGSILLLSSLSGTLVLMLGFAYLENKTFKS